MRATGVLVLDVLKSMKKARSKINEKVRIGVIGLGHQSLEDHIPAIKNISTVKLTAVADIDKSKLNGFLRHNKNVRGYVSPKELLSKERLDAIIIALPHHLHYDITKLAVSKKIHVLKEKPFAVSLAEAKKISDLVKKNDVTVCTAVQRRFNPIYSTFLQLADRIGRPFYIESKYTIFTDKPDDGWRGNKKLAGGGCIIDMGYHMIDLLIWYFGLPDKLMAEASCEAKEGSNYDAEDTAEIIFKYSNKKLWGSLLISRVIPPKQEYFNVYGIKGFIHLERGKIERFSPDGILQESLSREDSWPSAFQDQIEFFLKVIKGEKENIGSPEFHMNHLAFVEAAYESMGKGMYINPQNLLEHIE